MEYRRFFLLTKHQTFLSCVAAPIFIKFTVLALDSYVTVAYPYLEFECV